MDPSPTPPPAILTPPPPPAVNAKLHTVGGITLATFLGSPLAGAIAMALNYRRSGNRRAARKAVLWGIVGTAALIAVSFLLPQSFHATPIALASILSMRQLAKSLQGAMLQQHKAAGGITASMWRSAGLGLLVLAAVAVVLFAAIAVDVWIFEPMRMGTRVEITAHEEIYYSGTATEADARKLGEALKQIGWFGSTAEKTVLLEKKPTGTVISLVVGPAAWQDPNAHTVLAELADELAPAIGGKPITMRFVDVELQTQREARVE